MIDTFRYNSIHIEQLEENYQHFATTDQEKLIVIDQRTSTVVQIDIMEGILLDQQPEHCDKPRTAFFNEYDILDGIDNVWDPRDSNIDDKRTTYRCAFNFDAIPDKDLFLEKVSDPLRTPERPLHR